MFLFLLGLDVGSRVEPAVAGAGFGVHWTLISFGVDVAALDAGFFLCFYQLDHSLIILLLLFETV